MAKYKESAAEQLRHVEVTAFDGDSRIGSTAPSYSVAPPHTSRLVVN